MYNVAIAAAALRGCGGRHRQNGNNNSSLSYELKFPSWIEVSSEAKDLVIKLLNKNPKIRYTAKQVLKHPFITGINDNRKPLKEI